MGLWSFICDCASSVVDLVCSVGSAICSGLSAALSALATPIATVLGLALGSETFKLCVQIIGTIARILGLVGNDTKTDELGARAIEHSEISVDSCGSYAAYIKALEEAEFDEEKYRQKDSRYHAQALLVGAGIEVEAIAEKYDTLYIPAEFYGVAAKGNLNGEQTKQLLDIMAENNVEDAGCFRDYLNQAEMDEAQADKMEKTMSDFEAKSGVSMEQILDNIEDYNEKRQENM